MFFNQYKQVEQKPSGRLFAVGDLHGCLDKLLALLASIEFDETQDQIIFVGDLADRGEQNLGVFDFILDKPHFHVVAGNHEHLLYEHVMGRKVLPPEMMDYWLRDDGAWTKDVSAEELQVIAEKLSEQCYFIIEAITLSGARFGITHGGYNTERWFDQNNSYEDDYFGRMMWSRTCAESPPNTLEPVTGIDFTVHGHTIFRKPYMNGNAIFIDTGCVAGGTLTALDLARMSQSVNLDKSVYFSV